MTSIHTFEPPDRRAPDLRARPHRRQGFDVLGPVMAAFLVLMVVLPAAFSAVGAAAPGPVPLAPANAASQEDSSLVNWSQLRYTTSKLLIFTGELNMVRSVSGDKLTVRTDSQARLFGSPFVDTWSLSTMDRKTGRPQEFLEVRPGKKAERWTFAGRAVQHVTLKPRTKSGDEPIEKWRVSKTETLAGPSPVPGSKEGPEASSEGEWVHDYISMIVRLPDMKLAKVGDEATVRVSTNRGPAPMRIRVGEERTMRRTLTDLTRKKSRPVVMKELRLRVTPLAGSSADTRGFLNMEGETELWVDAATRTLTEISGNVPKVPGRVVITLAGYK